MKAGIIGLGYVALVAAACFTLMDNDVDHGKIDKLKLGVIPVYEPGLSTLVKENLFIDGRNQFRTDFIESKGFKYVQIGVKE
ncbi:MAG: hypothetical protein HN522_06510 [Flavobacteriales bacterium]|jgi:UDPglucose 6-dehydrogenase|nr:hypothetical protein [Flavobacteriales bacterium]MBT5750952.1 hypothetical protein [Flavobacteriales bacterium]